MKTNKAESRGGAVKLKTRLDRFMEKRTAWVKPVWVENVYIASLVVFLVITILSSYFVHRDYFATDYIRIVKYLAVLMMGIKILLFDLRKYTLKHLILLILALVCFGVSAFISNNRSLLLTYIAVIAAFGLDFRRILWYFLLAVGGLFIAIVFCSLIGLVPDLVYYRGEMARHSLGFIWCATPAIFGWSLSMAYLYYRGKGIGWMEVFAIMVANILLGIVTGTRLECACVLIGVIIAVINKKDWFGKEKRVGKAIRIPLLLFPIVLTIVSFLFAFLYNASDPFLNKINTFSSSRLSLSHRAVSEYGLTMFGNNVEWRGMTDLYAGTATMDDYSTVDNSYLSIFLRFGLVCGILVLFGYYLLVRKVIMQQDLLLGMILIIIFIHSLLNPHLVVLVHNAFLLLIANKTMGCVNG